LFSQSCSTWTGVSHSINPFIVVQRFMHFIHVKPHVVLFHQMPTNEAICWYFTIYYQYFQVVITCSNLTQSCKTIPHHSLNELSVIRLACNLFYTSSYFISLNTSVILTYSVTVLRKKTLAYLCQIAIFHSMKHQTVLACNGYYITFRKFQSLFLSFNHSRHLQNTVTSCQLITKCHFTSTT